MNPEDTSEKALRTHLRRQAMDTLARREHSRYELATKLSSKNTETPIELIDEVLDQLEADRLLSDERFAEAYVRYRKSRGFGPIAIRHHLRSCRVADSLIDEHLSEDDPEWMELLAALHTRKTGLDKPEPESSQGFSAERVKQKQKLERFLLSRGFTPGQIRTFWRG